jgi:hypothetical protein
MAPSVWALTDLRTVEVVKDMFGFPVCEQVDGGRDSAPSALLHAGFFEAGCLRDSLGEPIGGRGRAGRALGGAIA